MSRIREKANELIIRELEAQGIVGIVPSHGEILSNLFVGEQYTMKELAEKIHRTKPTVTVLVDKLVEYGYVLREKSATDNRVTYINLTEKGRGLQPAFKQISQKLNTIIYAGLTDEQAESMERKLENIYSRFQ